MVMSEISKESFAHLRKLYNDINAQVPDGNLINQRLRNEIAGMFSVTIFATYEGVVKETLISYASKFHLKYQNHVERDYARMNSKITIGDLYSLSKTFGLPESTEKSTKKDSTLFHQELNKNKIFIEQRFRTQLIKNYENIFQWRNAYAHQRDSLVTLRNV